MLPPIRSPMRQLGATMICSKSPKLSYQQIIRLQHQTHRSWWDSRFRPSGELFINLRTLLWGRLPTCGRLWVPSGHGPIYKIAKHPNPPRAGSRLGETTGVCGLTDKIHDHGGFPSLGPRTNGRERSFRTGSPANPWPVYDQLHAESPVLYVPPPFNGWMVFDYETVKWIMTGHASFSSRIPAPNW